MTTAATLEVAPVAHAGWSTSPIASWIAGHGGVAQEADAFFGELCDRIVAAEVPLFRVSSGILTLHPQVWARNLQWHRDDGPTVILRPHGLTDTDMFRNSPFEALLEGSGGFRQRIEGHDADFDFPLLGELRGEGATDYVIMPLKFTTGSINYISWATDRAGGFTTADLALLYDLLPLIALRLEIDNAYRVSRALLGVYLGKDPARRVFKGKIRRGDGEQITAALLYADLRNFTGIADRWRAQDVLDLLNAYFERIVGAVESQDGEILKFMGDAALAIFPFREGDSDAACCRALDAAVAGLTAMDRLNADRVADGLEPVALGIALHLGEVTFGNIGAPGRLDFTVIGRAVNEVSRLDALCASLDRPLLTSASFADSCGRNLLVSMGPYVLRGVSAAQEIFTMPDAVLAADTR